jgi:hypothetical protein
VKDGVAGSRLEGDVAGHVGALAGAADLLRVDDDRRKL